MAATRTSKLIALTNLKTGVVFMLSINKIIKYTASGSNTLMTFISQKGKIKTVLVTEGVAAIWALTVSNVTKITQAITLLNGKVLYINNDRVIFIDTVGANTVITYDEGDSAPVVYTASLPTPANFKTASDNILSVVTQGNSQEASRTRWINNLFISMVSPVAAGVRSEILYDVKKTGFEKIETTSTPAAIQTVVNALIGA